MGTIAEKLSYLADTKDLFKDRLNSLGAEITSSTTFRNYLNWLDTFYGEVSDKTDLSVNGVVGRTSQNTAILPSEYTQVDYIESHGEEWIDTNVFPYRTTVEYTFAYNNFTTGTYRRFVASFDATSSPTLRYYSCQANGDNPDRFVCASYANTIYGLGYTDTNKHTIIFNDNNGNVYFDGILKATSENFDLPRQSANNLSIFATGGATGSSKIAGKLWSLKIYDKENNNELVRDFIPCYRNSDNEVGLYDLVNGVFYTNQGTGAFTYGSVVSIPNPDYPQAINNLSGDVAYKVSGKNLNNGIDYKFYIDSSATHYRVSGTDNGVCIEVDGASNYTISTATTQTRYRVACSNSLPTTTSQNCYKGNNKDGTSDNIIINTSGYKYLLVNATDLTAIQIEKGSTVTTYEPYISQTFDIPLGDIELCKIDTYEDKIYSSNGRFYLNKKTGKVVLNGSESWKKTNTQYQGLFSASITLPTMKRQNIFSGDIYANYFKENKFATQEEGITKSSSPLSYDVIIIRLFENRASDVKSFITWLSTHNTEVQYVLATPTTTEITQENYPSLYNALKQIQDYLTAYKINKEFILGYSSPEIEY